MSELGASLSLSLNFIVRLLFGHLLATLAAAGYELCVTFK